MTPGKKRKFILCYTLAFALLALGVYFPYLRAGRLIISASGDRSRHYTAALYCSGYLRGILRTLFTERRLVIPAWDMELGEGGDILLTLNSCGVCDPLGLLAFLVPSEGFPVYYIAAVILRLYLSGLAFTWMYGLIRGSFFVGDADPAGVHSAGTPCGLRFAALLIAGLGYAFCAWNIHASVSDPSYLTLTLFMPVILGGVEKILRRESPVPLAAAFFFLSLTGLYHLYVTLLLTLLYLALRLGDAAPENFRKAGAEVLRILRYALAGILPAAFVWLPAAFGALSGSSAAEYDTQALYTLSQYESALKLFFLPGTDTCGFCGGFGLLGLACVLLLFLKKGRGRLRLLFLLCLLTGALPVLGRLLNAAGSAPNRWIWFTALVVNCAVAEMLPEAVACLKRPFLRRTMLTACFALACGNIVYAGYYNGELSPENRTEVCRDLSAAGGETGTDAGAALAAYKESAHDGRFSRCVLPDTCGSGSEFSQTEEDCCSGRMIPLALAGTRYYVVPAGSGKPRSYFRLAEAGDRYDIYEDPYFTGISYLYDSCASRSDFESLKDGEQEQALLACAVLEDRDAVALKSIRRNDLENVKSRSLCIGHMDGQKIESDGTAALELPLEENGSGEKLLSIRGLRFYGEGETPAVLTVLIDGELCSEAECVPEESPEFTGVRDYAVNLNAAEDTAHTVTVLLTRPGTYEFRSADVYYHSLEQTLSRIGGLQASGMENEVIGDDVISGTVTVPEQAWLLEETAAGTGEQEEEARPGKSMLLCLAVPCSVGWKAAVDGEETKVYQTNVKCMSVEVPAGTHEVIWTYRRPLGTAGLLVTVLSLAWIFGSSVYQRKRRKPAAGKTEEETGAEERKVRTRRRRRTAGTVRGKRQRGPADLLKDRADEGTASDGNTAADESTASDGSTAADESTASDGSITADKNMKI